MAALTMFWMPLRFLLAAALAVGSSSRERKKVCELATTANTFSLLSSVGRFVSALRARTCSALSLSHAATSLSGRSPSKPFGHAIASGWRRAKRGTHRIHQMPIHQIHQMPIHQIHQMPKGGIW